MLILLVFKSLYDSEVKGYMFDLDKVKKLLDDVGYKDVDGDGICEDKEGKLLEIKFVLMLGGEIV